MPRRLREEIRAANSVELGLYEQALIRTDALAPARSRSRVVTPEFGPASPPVLVAYSEAVPGDTATPAERTGDDQAAGRAGALRLDRWGLSLQSFSPGR